MLPFTNGPHKDFAQRSRGAEAKTQRGNIAALYKQRKLRKMVDTWENNS